MLGLACLRIGVIGQAQKCGLPEIFVSQVEFLVLLQDITVSKTINLSINMLTQRMQL